MKVRYLGQFPVHLQTPHLIKTMHQVQVKSKGDVSERVDY